METYTDWSNALGNVFTQLVQRLAQYLPSLLGAIALLLIGWVAARILRTIAVRLMTTIDHLLHRFHRDRGLQRPKVPSASADILGSIVYWVVILFFLTAATQVMGLEVFSAWLSGVVQYLPTLFAGGLIILAGFLVSALARDVVVATAPVNEQQRLLLGRIVQGIILVTAVVIGAQQIGLDVTFLVILATVVAGTLLGGVALAVSLGARTYVSNLIGAHYLRQSYHAGQTVRVADYEGKILELTPTTLVLETADGRVTLPAKVFGEQPITLVIGNGHDG